MNEQDPQYQQAPQYLQPAPEKKSKKWHWILGTVAVLGIISAVSGGGDEDPAAADHPSEKVTETVTADPEPQATEKATPKPKPKPKPKPAPAPAAMEVTAATMLDEFEGNEAAADLKYKGKTVEVTGVVDKVDTEFWDDEQYTIQLSDGDEWALWTVNCNDVSGETAAKVKVGSTVTVIGEFDDGGDLGVEIATCTLA